jgi:hypothetical protein
MDFKDLYIAEVERIAADLEDAGISADRAYDLASEQAFDAARDRLADLADYEWQREKDARLFPTTGAA